MSECISEQQRYEIRKKYRVALSGAAFNMLMDNYFTEVYDDYTTNERVTNETESDAR